ncbi:MAG: ATP-binding protein, partial [Thermodesulfobacteriota bacterium]|nr:ATP-binding protein [Thermodesulfobacteriota bacterium]
EKGQLGQQLIVAGRLAEIGEMSAGFAHEINNPLQIIRAEQTLMGMIISELIDRGDLKESKDLEEFTESLDQIKTQVDRCAEITQGLLKFARQKDTVPRDLDLHDFVPEVIRMVEKKAEVEGIAIKQEIPDNIPTITADAPQLQQVLLNFLNNAVFAVQEKYDSTGGGEITVGLSSRDDQVDIAVTDNGSGISSENLKKIFTPFFSTKPVGRGTGLGLSICYGIIEKMGGVIEVSSTEGKGTTFTIRLPMNV